MKETLLKIRDLEVQFDTRRGVARAVNRVNLDLRAGERFGLVGESGSGKTTLILALLRMIKQPGHIVAGKVLFGDVDLVQLSDEQVRKTRLSQIAMIPQGAMNSLNPVMRISDQLILTMREHGKNNNKNETAQYVNELMELVGLRPDVGRLYPHQLSGGMKQRVCIALAISLRPRLILADEPSSALDVVVQQQVMQTLRRLHEQLNATVLLVGHDMGLMAQFAQRVGIMYGGKLVEVGRVEDIFSNPKHPYTQLLISSIPSFKHKGELKGIPGVALSLLNSPSGCLFHPRCPKAVPQCSRQVPQMRTLGPDHQAACLLYDE